MIDYLSRYCEMETRKYRMPDGSEVAYISRRFLPQGEKMRLLTEVEVTEGDRLDNITARSIGEPEQFWRVCDANNAMNPFHLTDEPGTKLRIPVPEE
ncbi:MAG: hypothetical protein OEY64_10590 [Nitrospinota bacterium]|nr:hypothetical protein [Nitrospinota bacterium]